MNNVRVAAAERDAELAEEAAKRLAEQEAAEEVIVEEAGAAE